MNYLAHILLSGDNPDVKIGNFIGDYVKGNQYLKYSEDIQRGILLHRQIDKFTDTHPLVKDSMLIFRPKYRKYAGVIVDVVYDHFLTHNWSKYSDVTLNQFVNETHKLIMRRYFSLPNKIKQFLPYLIRSRRLEAYAEIEGLRKTFHIMSGHTSLPDFSNWAVEQVEENYDLIESQFLPFFDEIREMAANFLNKEDILIHPSSPDHSVATA